MIDPKIKKLLEQMALTAHGKALKQYLETQIKLHTDISKLNSIEELLGAQMAVKILKDVLYFLEVQEKPSQQKDKNQYV